MPNRTRAVSWSATVWLFLQTPAFATAQANIEASSKDRGIAVANDSGTVSVTVNDARAIRSALRVELLNAVKKLVPDNSTQLAVIQGLLEQTRTEREAITTQSRAVEEIQRQLPEWIALLQEARSRPEGARRELVESLLLEGHLDAARTRLAERRSNSVASWLFIPGAIAFGAGAIAGSIFWVLGDKTVSAFDCPDCRTQQDAREYVQGTPIGLYDTVVTVSWIGVGMGAAAMLAGGVVWSWGAWQSTPEQPTGNAGGEAKLRIGPGGLSLCGSF